LGFEVIAAGPEFFSDMDRVAATVNSCDVLAGVHGAGLTNMVFLPHNATVVQIIPYGKMTYPCRHTYGDPVAPMGLRYVEYEATAEETTLKDKYPKDHVVFTDPDSVTSRGSTRFGTCSSTARISSWTLTASQRPCDKCTTPSRQSRESRVLWIKLSVCNFFSQEKRIFGGVAICSKNPVNYIVLFTAFYRSKKTSDMIVREARV
jgi:hypothetical protein